jgi:hypothetical protein
MAVTARGAASRCGVPTAFPACRLGVPERWEIVLTEDPNRTDKDARQPPSLVWKDTVLVPTGQTVDLLLDVTNAAYG